MALDELPALLGGAPIRPQGPPSWPPPDPEIQQALAALGDGSWGQYLGSYIPALETALASYQGVPFALTCASGTLAVEAALRALKVGPGDEVILAAYEYEANFLTIHAVGAMPVLVDVHPENWNLNPERLEKAISPQTKALIATHLHGGIVPMGSVMAIARARGLPVVEDAAQAPGSIVEGQKAGTWGDVGVLSFGGSKLLSAGRGGALLIQRSDVLQRARLWLSRGIQQWAALSEMQAAVLLPQLAKLDERTAYRAQQVRTLGELVRDVPGWRLFSNTAPNSLPGYYKVGFQFEEKLFGLGRERFVAALRAEGIAFDEGFRALHIGRGSGRFRAACDLVETERAHRGAVTLHHPILMGDACDIEQVAAAVRKTYRNASRLRI